MRRLFQFTIKRLLGIILVVAVAAWLISLRDSTIQSARDLDRLLMSNGDVNLRSIEIVNQQRRVVCNHSDALQYIAKMMSSANRRNNNGGSLAYKCTFYFSTGRHLTVDCEYGSQPGFSLSVPNDHPFEEGDQTRFVDFHRPIPPSVIEMRDFLLKDHVGVSGQTLYLENE